MASSLRKYDSSTQLLQIVNAIIADLTPEQCTLIMENMERDEEAWEIKNRLAPLPRPIRTEDIPRDILLPMQIKFMRTILASLPHLALDPQKRDAIELMIEVFDLSDLIRENNRRSLTFSTFDEARYSLVQERFTEKPFLESCTNVKYQYDGERIPISLRDHFTKIIQEALIAALDEDRNADLSVYEKAFGITITNIEHPKRSKIANAVPKTLKDVIL